MNNSEIENKKNDIKRNQKQAYGLICVGIAALIVAPFLFTRPGTIDFSQTGQIGDTIGGITAPIVNLVAAVLVYLSFKQQLVANEIQIELIKSSKSDENARIEKELLKIQLDEVKRSIQDLSYTSRITHNKSNGIDAIVVFAEDVSTLKKAAIENSSFPIILRVIIGDIYSYLHSCKGSQHLSKREKMFFRNRMHYTYFHQLSFPLSGIDAWEDDLPVEQKLSVYLKQIDDLLPGIDIEPA